MQPPFVIVLESEEDPPRYLIVDELPERISPAQLFPGIAMRVLPNDVGVDVIYKQSGGPGTDWVRPHEYVEVSFTGGPMDGRREIEPRLDEHDHPPPRWTFMVERDEETQPAVYERDETSDRSAPSYTYAGPDAPLWG